MHSYKSIMDEMIQDVIDKGDAIGANVLVLHKGKELYHNVFGYADKESKIPIKRDTIFRIFSMTKPVTACATMILFERGKIDLWDPVSKYIPSFSNQTVLTSNGVEPANRQVTIWDLLNMTSGIPYPDVNFAAGQKMQDLFDSLKVRLDNGTPASTLEYCKLIGEMPLAFQPGKEWLYGLNADILGGIIEVVSGTSYGTFLKDEIFDPLNMNDTSFYVPSEKSSRFATNYIYDEKRKELVPFLEQFLGLEGYHNPIYFESGGAGLVSTIDDYSKFAQMMGNKGSFYGKHILGQKTIDFMAQNRLSESQSTSFNWESNLGYGYGCLMRILQDTGIAGSNGGLGEFGWDGWAGTYVTINPLDDIIIIYMIQLAGAGTSPIVRKIRNVTYSYIK